MKYVGIDDLAIARLRATTENPKATRREPGRDEYMQLAI